MQQIIIYLLIYIYTITESILFKIFIDKYDEIRTTQNIWQSLKLWKLIYSFHRTFCEPLYILIWLGIMEKKQSNMYSLHGIDNPVE